jgi:large subunit ribosomal protein L9
MKILLKESIENLGRKGDVVNVAAGYGRNYLIPKQMALEVTSTNVKMIEMVQNSLRKGLEKEMKAYQSLIDRLNSVTLTFARKTADKDTLFGSVNVNDIRDALIGLKFDIEKKKILLEDPIKRLGNYTIPIKVFQDERAEIKLEVVREGEPEPISAEEAAQEEPGPDAPAATSPPSESAPAPEAGEGAAPEEAVVSDTEEPETDLPAPGED